jgi:RNA polymerase sigma factor (sigma-70 family)
MPSRISEVVQHLRRAVLRSNDGEPTDGRLLGRFVELRDEAAIAALMQRHGPMVWGVCRRVLSHHDAEDAFQATFLVLVRRAASVVPREMVGNWLYGVAHQTALKARAMRAKRLSRERQGMTMPDVPAAGRDGASNLEELLDQELSRLPDMYRVAIVLCDLEGKTRKAVAGQLGLPEGTLAGRLMRGRALLARRLARRGVALSAGALATALTQQASGTMPAALLQSAIRSVTLVAAGQASAGLIPTQVAALAEGTIRGLLLARLKTALLMIAVAILVGGVRHTSLPTKASGVGAEPPVVAQELGTAKTAVVSRENFRKEAPAAPNVPHVAYGCLP